MDLATELQKIYDSTINIEVSWMWDGGIDVRLGDRMNGYVAAAKVRSVADLLPWLQKPVAHFYPTSTYALGLDDGLRERAARQIFLPAQNGVYMSAVGGTKSKPQRDARDDCLRLPTFAEKA